MTGGEVTFDFKGDDSDLNKKTSELSSKMKSVAKGIGKAFVAGTAVVGTSLVGLIGKSVQMAGELEQNIGGSEAVFKSLGKSISEIGTTVVEFDSTTGGLIDNFQTIETLSQNAFSNMGLSASDYMATLNKMGSLMQGSGIETEKSLELSAEAMQRAADVASIMGIDIDSAMESIAGAAKGNFTMMDNLGVAMNATSIEAYALSKGIKTSYNEMDQAQKIGLAMEMFLEKTSYATGNYAKENETFSGSLQTLKGAFSNFMSGSGSIEDVNKSLTKFGTILMKSIVEMAPNIVNGIVDLTNAIIPQIPGLIQTLLPVVIEGTMALATGLINALPQLVTMIATILPTILMTLANGLVQIINQLAQMLPTLIPVIIQGILGIIPILLQNLPLFINAGVQLLVGLANGLVDSLPMIIDMLPTIIQGLVEGLVTLAPTLATVGPTLILKLAWGLMKAVPQLLSKIPEIIMSMLRGFKDGVSNFIDIGGNLVKGLWQGISGKVDWVIGKIKGFGNSILKGIKEFFGIHSPSTEFAWIGRMNMEGMVIGMKDMEEDVQSTFDSMFDLSPSLYGSTSTNLSSNVNIVVNNTMNQDPLGQIVDDIKTFSGGSKNDYNYGTGV